MNDIEYEDMLYTVSEVANILKTNSNYVYNLIKNGDLKALKLGSLKIRKKTLEEFLDRLEIMDVSKSNDIEYI